MTKKNKRCTKFPKKEMKKLRFHTLALHQGERLTLKTKSTRHIDLSHNGYQIGHFGKYIHVQYTRTESDRLGYATVRLTGSPIARDLEKYTEVFTEGVKCCRIDSIGHGRTRPVSLCVGSTERKSDRERLRKIH